jgi:hypothetical protein
MIPRQIDSRFLYIVDIYTISLLPLYLSISQISPHHNLTFETSSAVSTCPSVPSLIDFNQPSIAPTSPSTSATVFPACKHTRTLPVPGGTVGGKIALTTNPAAWQCCARGRGRGVRREKMGDCGRDGGIWRRAWRPEREMK